MFRSPKLQRQRQQLLLLGVAACVVLFALKSTNCTPQTTAVCRDHGDEGSMRQGGEHVVCIYQDRVIKTVKTCSKKKWPHQIINDHLRCATQQASVTLSSPLSLTRVAPSFYLYLSIPAPLRCTAPHSEPAPH